jgi:hypothetical protein
MSTGSVLGAAATSSMLGKEGGAQRGGTGSWPGPHHYTEAEVLLEECSVRPLDPTVDRGGGGRAARDVCTAFDLAGIDLFGAAARLDGAARGGPDGKTPFATAGFFRVRCAIGVVATNSTSTA